MADRPLIDLGLLSRPGPAGEAPGRDRVRGSGPGGWWPRQRWAASALAILLAWPLAGAAHPSPPGLVALWTVPDSAAASGNGTGTVAAGGDRLYVGVPTDRGWTLTAHRLRDGRVDWRVPLAYPGLRFGLRVVAGVPVVTTHTPAVADRTSGYDPVTGARRWSHAGTPYWEFDGLVVLVEERFATGFSVVPGTGRIMGPVPEGRYGGARFLAVDPVSGQVVGDGRIDSAEHVAGWRTPDGTGHLFTLAGDGTLTRHAVTPGGGTARTGTPYRAWPVTGRQHRAQATGTPYRVSTTALPLMVANGLVVVSGSRAGVPVLAAYDPVTLDHRWSVPGGWMATGCGVLVCVVTSDRWYRFLHGIDPGTGASRWSLRCAQACGLFATPLPGLVWVERYTPHHGGTVLESWIVDSGTGRPVTGRTGWRLAQAVDGGGLLLYRSEAGPADPDRTRWIWWARAGPGLTDVEVLGAVEADACTPYQLYLVCSTDGADLRVWGAGTGTGPVAGR